MAEARRTVRPCHKETGMDELTATGFKPPYLPFKTFWSFVEELRSKPLPPEIDRSLLRTKSGTDQANLISAFKAFGLISETQAVEANLRQLISADESGAKSILQGLLRSRYPRQFELSEQNGTEKALNDSFEEDFGVTADTRRKAVTFFLQASRFAGIKLSPHFPVTRLGSGRPAGIRPKQTAKRKTLPIGAPTGNAGTRTPECVTADLGAGTVTMIVDVRWLDLDDSKFVALRKLTADLRELDVGVGDAGSDED
jgi:hypothetical protein